MFLEINNVVKSFGTGENKSTILRGVNASINKGEFVVMLGPSGCGKSTLLNILGGIDHPDSGYIAINGNKLEGHSEKELIKFRREHLGYVFQSYNLIPNLTVKENIEVGKYLTKNPLNINEILESLGLAKQANKIPNQLSGGQQQRVSIGRAIIKNPDILLADEPTGALDYKTSKEILEVFEKVNKEYGCTIIMVTHNAEIRHMADRVITMKDGVVLKNEVNETKVLAKDLEW